MLTQEKFRQRATAKHGGKYSYDHAIYTGTLNKLTITCPQHGDFQQLASAHIAGQGCKVCSMEKLLQSNRLNTDIFKTRAISTHGSKYNYDKVNYINHRDKVIITCPQHGDYEQPPTNHIRGYGCGVCAELVRFNNLRGYDHDEFIVKAKEVHGTRYGYSRTEFTDGNKRVIINCSIHGDFEQKPRVHLNGSGCVKCAGIFRPNTEEFIRQAEVAHNSKYTYAKFVYTTSRKKGIITCPTHGDFEQTARRHLKGQGCPVCKSSKGELRIKAILDKNNIRHIREYSIPGVTPRFRYDFYLPDHRLLIEFHGGQHYFPVEFFGGREAFRSGVLRDFLKRSTARSLKIPLLVFNFKHLRNMSQDDFDKTVLRKIAKASTKLDGLIPEVSKLYDTGMIVPM